MKWAVSLAGFCAFLNLYVTQPLLPHFQKIFGASEQAVSFTVGAAVLAVALAAPLAGIIADMVERKKVIVISLAGLAVPTLLVSTASGLSALIGWRFLGGLFIPGVVATTMAYISEESPLGTVGSIMATYVTGTVIGGFCGRFIAGIATAHFGWQSAFLILGVLTLTGTVAVWRLLPASRRFNPQQDPGTSIRDLVHHLHNRHLLVTYAVGSQVNFSLVSTFTYVNFYLAVPPFKLNSSALGSIFFVYLIGAVITPLAGRLIDRLGNRRTLALSIVGAATGMLFTLPHHLWSVIIGLGICCTGIFICQAAASGQVGKVAGKARSSAAGLYVAFYYTGGGIGSVVPGVIWGFGGWPACVILIMTLQIATATLAYFTWKEGDGMREKREVAPE